MSKTAKVNSPNPRSGSKRNREQGAGKRNELLQSSV